MRRRGRSREFPAKLAEFAEADWLDAPTTEDEAFMFGDVAYWLAHPDMADKLRWSLAFHRWDRARLSWAEVNLSADGWCDVFVEMLAVPLYTRPVV